MEQHPSALIYGKQLQQLGIKPIGEFCWFCTVEHDENECSLIRTIDKPSSDKESATLPALTFSECDQILKASNIAITFNKHEDGDILNVSFRGNYKKDAEMLKGDRSDSDIAVECIMHLINAAVLDSELINQILVKKNYERDNFLRQQSCDNRIATLENNLLFIENSVKDLTILLKNVMLDLEQMRNL